MSVRLWGQGVECGSSNEVSPIFSTECLVPRWWHCSGRVGSRGLAGGSVTGGEVGGLRSLILTRQGEYHDDEGGFPRVRLIHCLPLVPTPAISPNVGDSTA